MRVIKSQLYGNKLITFSSKKSILFVLQTDPQAIDYTWTWEKILKRSWKVKHYLSPLYILHRELGLQYKGRKVYNETFHSKPP